MISPERLVDDVDDYIVLDVRRLVEYRAGHIPYALPCSFANFIKIWGVALMPADSEDLVQHLSKLGVDMARTIVVYDIFYGRHAARAVYILELLGFSELALLDRTFDMWPMDTLRQTRSRSTSRRSFRGSATMKAVS